MNGLQSDLEVRLPLTPEGNGPNTQWLFPISLLGQNKGRDPFRIAMLMQGDSIVISRALADQLGIVPQQSTTRVQITVSLEDDYWAIFDETVEINETESLGVVQFGEKALNRNFSKVTRNGETLVLQGPAPNVILRQR